MCLFAIILTYSSPKAFCKSRSVTRCSSFEKVLTNTYRLISGTASKCCPVKKSAIIASIITSLFKALFHNSESTNFFHLEMLPVGFRVMVSVTDNKDVGVFQFVQDGSNCFNTLYISGRVKNFIQNQGININTRYFRSNIAPCKQQCNIDTSFFTLAK
ncbi:hypothetical protein CJ20_301 [Escherichia phage CJ20]|nr:hypothetical protein CJ20_301 [Escherichia phage CJ20]